MLTSMEADSSLSRMVLLTISRLMGSLPLKTQQKILI